MPQTSHHVWTEQELHLLGLGIRKYKYNWVKISQEFLPHLNSISIKNKFYKRPPEIQGVINQLGLKRDKSQIKEPTMEDLQQIEYRLEKELAEIRAKISKKQPMGQMFQQSPYLVQQQSLSPISMFVPQINIPTQQPVQPLLIQQHPKIETHNVNQSIDWGKPIIVDDEDKNKGLANLLDNYSQQFAGYLNPIYSFDDSKNMK
ncbi:hypothetical protein SS50377_26490 [Spironucleus salmonicida]|uniref:Myb-like DNA-binding domain-containing protein n=1 Tax=Spironucleus salmonicida TaxID=348837 RepID=V6LA91_9EUKA|nr:hypothetical protein SS50377_26490 [Spironucleus salmonicida]|eukprot:EST41345.1 Hypothetical protein SS50377_19059 [Spironucleus salmonicida]